jgi:endonuclease/exonuclease/phosphatase family metal-dependent hydrolase
MALTVMTLNLLYAGAVNPAGTWEARLPLVLEVIRKGAGVIALQEATPPQLQDLRHALPEFSFVEGPESGHSRLPRVLQRGKGPRHGEHCAILYRTRDFTASAGSAFWLSHTPDSPGSILRGTWLPRVVNWTQLQAKATGRLLTVYNAHLDFLPWAPLRSAKILRRMLDTHWDGSLQILLGDFNAAPRSAAYKHLGAELKQTPYPPLVDAWEVAQERVGPEKTYHGGTGRLRWMGRLDRVLFRPQQHPTEVTRVTTLTHHHGNIYPSDHYPLLVEFAEDTDGKT